MYRKRNFGVAKLSVNYISACLYDQSNTGSMWMRSYLAPIWCSLLGQVFGSCALAAGLDSSSLGLAIVASKPLEDVRASGLHTEVC